jgi:biotin synthase-like enzyme
MVTMVYQVTINIPVTIVTGMNTEVINEKIVKDVSERILLLESHVRQYYTLVRSLTTRDDKTAQVEKGVCRAKN